MNTLQHNNKTCHRGFTLLELLVVMSIFVVISTLLVANYNKFGSNLSITSLAHDIALSIREAQVYGIAVKRADTQEQVYWYGIRFSNSDALNYFIFADIDKDGRYGSGDQVMKRYTLGNGNSIKKVCGYNTGNSGNPCGSVQWVDIVFKRPNPEAFMYANTGTPYNGTVVCIQSPKGKNKVVVVEATGQISVTDPNHESLCQ
jgi:prepilin-type N-terminal cleavage/methylation domain-containing protein